MSPLYWERHPDGPFVTLIAVAATYLHPESDDLDSLKALARRDGDEEMRVFKSELREALRDPASCQATSCSNPSSTTTELGCGRNVVCLTPLRLSSSRCSNRAGPALLQKTQQLARGLLGCLFWNEVTDWHRAAAIVIGPLLPYRERIIVKFRDRTALAPEEEHGAGDELFRCQFRRGEEGALPVQEAEVLVGPVVRVADGNDVHDGELDNSIRVIQCQTVGAARPAMVSRDAELVVVQLSHDLELVAADRACCRARNRRCWAACRCRRSRANRWRRRCSARQGGVLPDATSDVFAEYRAPAAQAPRRRLGARGPTHPR